jgi:hypothetical protein
LEFDLPAAFAAVGEDDQLGRAFGEKGGFIEDETVAGRLGDGKGAAVQAKLDADLSGVALGRMAKQYVGIS